MSTAHALNASVGNVYRPAVCLSDAAHAADACVIHTRHGRIMIDKVRSLCEAGVSPRCC